MVVKLIKSPRGILSTFESCVVLDGSQTWHVMIMFDSVFESCVVLDGSQTFPQKEAELSAFESCVVLDGSQTPVSRY